MPSELILPSAVMTLAFVAYSTGVWAERIARDLKRWHVTAFWLGWILDAYGTLLMERLRAAGEQPGLIHAVAGASAFILMGVHAAWATWVIRNGSTEARRSFHRYSLAVWVLWLIPYLGGMVAGVSKGLSAR